MTREQNYNDKDLVEIIGLPRSPLGIPGWIVDIGDVGPESALRQNGRFLKFIPQDNSQPVEYINANNIWGIRPFDPAAREAEQRASIQRMKDDLSLLRDETRLRSVTPEPRSIIRCASCKEVTFDRDEGSRPCACQRPVDSNPSIIGHYFTPDPTGKSDRCTFGIGGGEVCDETKSTYMHHMKLNAPPVEEDEIGNFTCPGCGNNCNPLVATKHSVHCAVCKH